MSAAVSVFNSQKFKFWSFISMVLLVFVHGYNLNERYLQPWSVVNEPMTFNTFTQFFLANALFRFRIPMLFIISGYLYALHDDKPYGMRTNKRVKTLLLPYVLWSAIGLAFTFALESFGYGREVVASSHLMQIDEHRLLLHEYAWWEALLRWLFAPVPFQLWFIRVLFVYNLAYPAIRWLVTTKARWFFFPLAMFLWVSTFGAMVIEGEGLLFFSVGVWMQKTSFNITVPGKLLSPKWWGPIFLFLCVTKTLLAFTGYGIMQENIYTVLAIMHKLIVFSGLVTAWYGCNALVRVCMQQQWFVQLSAFSFMIYALHVPLITYAINPVLNATGALLHHRFVSFVGLSLAVIAFCIAVGWVLRKLWPTGYAILTGGRGL